MLGYEKSANSSPNDFVARGFLGTKFIILCCNTMFRLVQTKSYTATADQNVPIKTITATVTGSIVKNDTPSSASAAHMAPEAARCAASLLVFLISFFPFSP